MVKVKGVWGGGGIGTLLHCARARVCPPPPPPVRNPYADVVPLCVACLYPMCAVDVPLVQTTFEVVGDGAVLWSAEVAFPKV